MALLTTNARLHSAATTVFTLIYFALLSSSSFAAPVIYLVSIGTPYQRVRQLSHRNIESVCPYDLLLKNGKGFTVECDYPDSVSEDLDVEISPSFTKMAFAVNGLGVRVENRKPYFISGDLNGSPKPWHRYPHVAVISCLPDGRSDNSSSVTVVFACHKTAADTHIGGNANEKGERDESEYAHTFSKDNMVDSSFNEPDRQDTPYEQGFETDETLPTTEPIADVTDLTMSVIPPPRKISAVLNDPNNKRSDLWTAEEPRKDQESQNIVSAPSSQPLSFDANNAIYTATTSPSTAINTMHNKSNDTEEDSDLDCIVVDARRDLVGGLLTTGWTIDEERDGLTFRLSDWTESLTPSGRSPLHYTMKPRQNSRYAVIIDMTTAKGSEHNDVWVRFTPGGLQAMRKGENKKIQMGWVKGYHNKKRRAAFVSTIDHNPHSLSTGAILTKGESYDVSIAGRSSMVTLHRIIMFPCRGVECMRSKSWNESLRQCVPDVQI